MGECETFETEVLIIGGGVTGTGVMRDLALRGIHCLLIDRRDLNAGASGGNHGLLHSGGRYASADWETAAECRQEGEILKRVATECIEDCGGLFVAVAGDDPGFAEQFPEHCRNAGIPCQSLSRAEAREREPGLTERLIAAYRVPDATVDPFRITLENVNHAQRLTGSVYLPHTKVTAFEIESGQIRAALCQDTRTGAARRILARQVVNAGGAWSMEVAGMAGCRDVNLLYSKGTLLISNTRLSRGVINRLRPPGDGDILVPGGTISLLGTTSDTVTGLQGIRPTVAEVERNLDQGIAMLPGLATTRFIRAFSGVRPLVQAAEGIQDGRQASRGFTLFDHESQGLENFATITGGKLTTFRLMAERTGDLVASRLGNQESCKTALEPLPTGDGVRWTKPGFSARYWYQRQDPTDAVLCECEMVPQSAIDAILETAPGAEKPMELQAIGLRSRVGKGACQGAFCSLRVTSYLYDLGHYDSNEGLVRAREFVSERFRGVRPVLWGEQLPQMELAEALHCSLMGLDRLDDLASGLGSVPGVGQE
ncbi:MAG: anaerobic glycerol-3-phosphate dehydrogenase subunit A [Gammaproteobacteria bacterium]|nr:anaerobic glycerol-3-phosphate dehydrogenase subunit A [Gammaproteobacteria bacterium]